jgi:hypothetical protein
MRGGCSLQLLQGEHPEKDRNLQREFEQAAAVLGPRYYPRGNVSIFCWPEAHKEVHVLCIHFVDGAESTAPFETGHDLPEDSILRYRR